MTNAEKLDMAIEWVKQVINDDKEDLAYLKAHRDDKDRILIPDIKKWIPVLTYAVKVLEKARREA